MKNSRNITSHNAPDANSVKTTYTEAEYLRLLMAWAAALINDPLEKIDSSIDALFQVVGERRGYDRLFVCRFDLEARTSSVVYQWCAPQVNFAQSDRHTLSFADFGDILPALQETKTGKIFAVQDLPDDLLLKNMLQKRNVVLFMLAPLLNKTGLSGLVGAEAISKEKTFSDRDLKTIDDLALLFTCLFRRHAEEEVQVKEKERLSNILEGTSAGTWEWNVQTGETVHDEKYAQLLGYKPEELGNTFYSDWEELTHPDDLEKSNEAHRRHFRGEVAYYECEYRMKHKRGHWVWVYDQGRIITRTKEGKPLKVSGILMDITERKKTEAELRSTKEMLELILDNIPQRIFWKDRHSVYLGCNKNLADTIGLKTPQEIIGKTDYDLCWTKEEAEKYLSTDRQVMEANRAEYHIIETMRLPEGGQGWADTNKIPLHDQEGKVIGVLGSFEDITERKLAQEALQLSEARNRALLDVIPDLMVNYSRQGNFLDIWVNDLKHLHPQTLQFYQQNELQDKNISDVFTEEIAADILKAIEAALDTGRLQIAEYCYECEGEAVYKESRMIASGTDEVISVVRDITQRKKYEAELKRLSFHDRLTGLYNRHFLETEMDQLDQAHLLPVSVIMADLNGLKLVNDTYGHSWGDKMLTETARILQSACRSVDIISRWGGDEFVILLPGITAQKAQAVCKRISAKCREALVGDIPLSVALGAAAKTAADKSLAETLREAEDAMYKQKLTESRSNKNAVLQALLTTLAEKSYETETHTLGMIDLALNIGNVLGLNDAELNRLILVITLHDIGKINIAEEILTKSEPLTAEEWEIIKQHPEIGFRIARATEDFAHVAKEILAHHERWDGAGYPAGLQGEAIPLLARITAIADAYEVMSNGRPYKKAMSRQEIIDEFKRCSGSQFDPNLVDIVITLI